MSLKVKQNSRTVNDLLLVDQIQEIRAKNNVLWMDIIRLALREAPEEARRLFREITENDRQVSKLTQKLARAGGHR